MALPPVARVWLNHAEKQMHALNVAQIEDDGLLSPIAPLRFARARLLEIDAKFDRLTGPQLFKELERMTAETREQLPAFGYPPPLYSVIGYYEMLLGDLQFLYFNDLQFTVPKPRGVE